MSLTGGLHTIKRWGGAQVWRARGRVSTNRARLWGGAHGLRIVCQHDTPPAEIVRTGALLDWARQHFDLATPAAVDALAAGRFRSGARDQLLFTFDDGLATNYDAARFLADHGVRAVFFVVPSLVDRSMEEFARFHAERGVTAHLPVSYAGARGLAASQVREMLAMGHRIGAHNYAHRDLGGLHDEASLEYEIGRSLDGVAELTGVACKDFAIGFGQPVNVSPEAERYLLARVPNVYACHRGLNAPGRSPRFLLRHAHELDHPLAFAQVCLEGGGDHNLHDRVELMLRRVGALPGGTSERAA